MNRRTFVTFSSCGVLAALAGCSGSDNVDSTPQLSAPNQSALEVYTSSYETTQSALETYNTGIATFNQNLTPADNQDVRVIQGDYPYDWEELSESMQTAHSRFTDSREGFNQAHRLAESSTIESACDDAIEWIDPHLEITGFFRDIGGPTAEFVNEHEQEISELSPPTPPEELKQEVRN